MYMQANPLGVGYVSAPVELLVPAGRPISYSSNIFSTNLVCALIKAICEHGLSGLPCGDPTGRCLTLT